MFFPLFSLVNNILIILFQPGTFTRNNKCVIRKHQGCNINITQLTENGITKHDTQQNKIWRIELKQSKSNKNIKSTYSQYLVLLNASSKISNRNIVDSNSYQMFQPFGGRYQICRQDSLRNHRDKKHY